MQALRSASKIEQRLQVKGKKKERKKILHKFERKEALRDHGNMT
jgi:hypothetical protein